MSHYKRPKRLTEYEWYSGKGKGIAARRRAHKGREQDTLKWVAHVVSTQSESADVTTQVSYINNKQRQMRY